MPSVLYLTNSIKSLWKYWKFLTTDGIVFANVNNLMGITISVKIIKVQSGGIKIENFGA